MDYFCLKLLSSSSWGCELKCCIMAGQRQPTDCHPPREDVSWNVYIAQMDEHDDRVILLVRMWVEMFATSSASACASSSSSWGCELKFTQRKTSETPHMSSSSWGCELKYYFCYRTYCVGNGHPPREDVSWNVCIWIRLLSDVVILLVRMWVEMNTIPGSPVWAGVILLVRMWVEISRERLKNSESKRHPPREDVSWNCEHFATNLHSKRHPPCEDVSWNDFVGPVTKCQ